MVTVTTDRTGISPHLKATVTVSSDSPFYAVEARATAVNEAFGRGLGYDLLWDDASSTNGVVSFTDGISSFTFDIEAVEIYDGDGTYRISVFVKDENGVWNDCGQLYTKDSEAVFDKDNNAVLAKRVGSISESYTSTYSGTEIDSFITEVLL